MDAQLIGFYSCAADALYFRLRAFYAEWMQFLILLVVEFGCFVLVFAGTAVVDAAERFSGWLAGLGGSNE